MWTSEYYSITGTIGDISDIGGIGDISHTSSGPEHHSNFVKRLSNVQHLQSNLLSTNACWRQNITTQYWNSEEGRDNV